VGGRAEANPMHAEHRGLGVPVARDVLEEDSHLRILPRSRAPRSGAAADAAIFRLRNLPETRTAGVVASGYAPPR
jgi:hypothetical protein